MTDAQRPAQAQHITARDNPFLKDLRRLSHESAAYRKQGRVWTEGDHLCRAAIARGFKPVAGVFSESKWAEIPVEYKKFAIKNIIIPDRLFTDISALESPALLGFVFELPGDVPVRVNAATVVLDRVQDAGNVGSILRSAAAFGFSQVIALKGTAALWSPKVLRAGMGAHWGLQLLEGATLSEVAQLTVPILATSSHRGSLLHEALQTQSLPLPCAWALGHEGQGISEALQGMARLFVRIAQPGGEESLNVAAAAAICLHASATAS
jgi:TrmH family RNA methyltransferase